MNFIEKRFNSFELKFIALILMVLDHIHYTFSGVLPIPIWFTMLGRISAPLFIYMVAYGMYYSKKRENYLFRLWLGSLFMYIGNNFMNVHFPLPSGGILINNIFATLFVICLIIYSIDKIKEHKGTIRIIFYICLLLLPVLSTVVIIWGISNQLMMPWVKVVIATIPSIIMCEGSILFVLLGVVFYYVGIHNKRHLAIFYSLFSLMILLIGYNPEVGIISMFLHNIQWIMILALPFMLLYNNQKGKSMKYFFYVFYPAHIYLLTILAIYIDKLKG